MASALARLFPRRPITPGELAGRSVAIDAFNALYHFLTAIRDPVTGEPLRDRAGRVTNHLSGLLYRTIALLEHGIRPVYVFDGTSPALKRETVSKRRAARLEARRRWIAALRAGVPALAHARAAAAIDAFIVRSSKRLLDLMGVPWVQAPSEGEAQCAWMCRRRQVHAAASQDFDALLFGAPRLVRNLALAPRRGAASSARRALELIELRQVLHALQLTPEQLVLAAVLAGTDYHEGVAGVGPVTAVRLARRHRTLKRALAHCRVPNPADIEGACALFLDPPHTSVRRLLWQPPRLGDLAAFLVRSHDFAPERAARAVQRLRAAAAASSARPSKKDLAAARNRGIRDVIAPGLKVLFVGINPSLYSAATGYHFARPGNRFWRALHGAGFTKRELQPSAQAELLKHGYGITNLVNRGTATAGELQPEEFVRGRRRLAAKVRRYRPRVVAFLGVGAYCQAFGRRTAAVGPQNERFEGAQVWLLPNPSGLNASYQLARLVQLFRRLRQSCRSAPAP